MANSQVVSHTKITQIDFARAGEITPAMRIVAEKEGRAPEFIREGVAAGRIAIPANIHHTSLSPEGVGEGLRTKVNVNLGISGDLADEQVEWEKGNIAFELGAEAIMDLSNSGKTQSFRTRLIEKSPAMIGTVPMYDAIGYLEKALISITAEDFLDVVRRHAEDGVDFVTIHAGMNRRTIESFKETGRLMNVVSRGGSLIFAWMEATGNENPFYEYYDDVLEILHKYDVTISIGDAMRPGCGYDATDAGQIAELIEIGKLTKRAWDAGVQVMVEGPGHVPLDQVAANMKVQQTICMGAPFYVLGPLVTDIAPGYDHITSAIGGAIAAQNGAAFLCYVTPAEHLALPNVEDVKQGIIASKIAAHAADIAKGVRGIIIPATMAVYKECILRGWTEAFIDAGCIVSTPTCGPCLGGYMGILAEGERCVSTTNRNFVGRMGHVRSEVYLASPATAAASALTGYITDPRTV